MSLNLHSGRIAAGELGVVVLVLDHGPIGCLVAMSVCALAFGRWRGRWLSARLSTVVGYLVRPRGAALAAAGGVVLELAEDGREVALPPLADPCVRLVVSVAPGDRRVLLGIGPGGDARRVGSVLDRAGIRYRPVDPRTGYPGQVEERWSGLVVDGHREACFRVPAGALGPVLGLPARATVGLDGDGLVVRVDAAAVDALRRAVPAATRMDGEHRTGLAATVPVPPWSTSPPGGAGVVVPAGGLVVGRDRHGRPVTVRLGAVPGLLAGSLAHQPGDPDPAAAPLVRLLALRAQAAGLAVAVRPDRLVDTASGRTLLLVRDRLGAADRDLLASAAFVVLAELDTDGAAVAGEALGLGTHAEWLTRLGTDLVGVVTGRSVRWARLDATPAETTARVPVA